MTALNDFEFLDFPDDKDGNINQFREEDMEVFTQSIGSAMQKRSEAYKAIDALADAAGESWFELGGKLERARILDLLDKLDQGLLSSEEDAKITIGVIRKMVENDTSIEGDSEESYSE